LIAPLPDEEDLESVPRGQSPPPHFGKTGEISVENRIAPEDRRMNPDPSMKLGTFCGDNDGEDIMVRNQVQRGSPAGSSQ
jgi:hypothetical protein